MPRLTCQSYFQVEKDEDLSSGKRLGANTQPALPVQSKLPRLLRPTHKPKVSTLDPAVPPAVRAHPGGVLPPTAFQPLPPGWSSNFVSSFAFPLCASVSRGIILRSSECQAWCQEGNGHCLGLSILLSVPARGAFPL